MEAKPDFKAMSTQKKLEYIWDYYRFHIMGAIFLAAALGSIIHHYATVKDSVLDMLFLNARGIEEEMAPFNEFLTEQGFDLNEEEIRVTTSLSFALDGDSYQQDYYSVQTFGAMFAAGELDILAFPYQIYNDFASAGYTADLRSIFTEEELASYEDIIIYATLTETGETFPSAFDLTGNAWLEEYGYYENGCYLAAAFGTDTPELTKDFLLYVLNY